MMRVVLGVLLALCMAVEGYDTMVWMCLERCGSNITADLAAISAHKNALTAVSYERFDLGLGGTIVVRERTEVEGFD
jgi:hypothetical protein